MQNITSTRWLDNIATNLSDVDALLLGTHLDDTSTSALSYVNWHIEKAFSENKSIVLNGKTIQYNYYSFSFDQITTGSLPEEDTIKKTGFVIPYLLNGKVRYIISRNSGALTILRKLLSYTGRNEIVKDPTSFTADMFVWLISKVYRSDNTLESESDELGNLTIDSVRGFKGDTEDLLTRVSAVGESVINIISTLSFLLESQKLNQITLDVAYRGHTNIDISLSNKNTASINADRYQGELLAAIDSPEGLSVVFLLLYTEILPLIIQSYQGEIANGQWGQGKCVEFLKSVADDLSDKVTKRVEELESRPEQLSFPLDNTVSAEEKN